MQKIIKNTNKCTWIY